MDVFWYKFEIIRRNQRKIYTLVGNRRGSSVIAVNVTVVYSAYFVLLQHLDKILAGSAVIIRREVHKSYYLGIGVLFLQLFCLGETELESLRLISFS